MTENKKEKKTFLFVILKIKDDKKIDTINYDNNYLAIRYLFINKICRIIQCHNKKYSIF